MASPEPTADTTPAAHSGRGVSIEHGVAYPATTAPAIHVVIGEVSSIAAGSALLGIDAILFVCDPTLLVNAVATLGGSS